MIQKDGSILLNDWSRGIQQTYLGDLKNVQGIDVFSVPGVALANQKMDTMGVDSSSYTGRTFTADDTTDRITVSLAVFTDGQAVTLTTTGTLPAGLSTGTTYYIIAVSDAVYKLASTLANALAGTAVDITDTGSGTHTIVGTQMGRVKKIVQNTAETTTNYRYFLIDEGGKVWVQYKNIWSHLPGNSTGSGQGLEIWKGYLFSVANSGKIDVYGPLTNVGGSAAWSAAWKTATGHDTFVAPTIAGSDDILYIAQGRYISSVEETSGSTFAPGTGASYSWTDTLFTTRNGFRIRCMCENGQYIAIGTWVGTTVSTSTIFAAALETKIADLIFWDRTPDAFYQNTIHINENGVNAVISINNLVYAVCGHEGRIYITNGTTAELFATIPNSVFDRQQNTTQHLFFFPNAIAHHRGKILIGVGSGDTTSSATLSPLGVYAIDPKTGAVVIEQVLASGNTGSSGTVAVGAIVSTSEQELYVGIYYDGSQTYPGSVNRVVSTSARYGTGAFIESGLFSVGSSKEKKTYTTIEVALGKALNTGEQIVIYYRKASTGSYTTLATLSTSTISDGSSTKYQLQTPLLADLTDVQFKVALVCTDIFTSPELIYVNIKERPS